MFVKLAFNPLPAKVENMVSSE